MGRKIARAGQRVSDLPYSISVLISFCLLLFWRRQVIHKAWLVMCEYDHPGFCSGWFFYITDTCIVNRDVFGALCLAVKGCYRSGIGKVFVRRNNTLCEKYHMGSGYVFCVQPDIGSLQLFVKSASRFHCCFSLRAP